jgi:hypothetical protein
VVNENIYAPTITCSDNSEFIATAYAAAEGSGLIAAQNANNWKTGGAAYYSTAGKSIYGVAGKCGEEEVTGSCPQLTITTGPAATCVFNTHSWEVGKPVSAPTIGCSGGATAGGTYSLSKVSGKEATDSENWATGGTATYSETGSSIYQVSGVTCNDIPVDAAECNTLTITAPIPVCEFAKNSYKVGENVGAPALSCENGNAIVKTAATFSKVSGLDAANYTNWATGGNATYSATGSSKYKVSGVTCGGYAAADAECTALTITPAPTITCTFTPATYEAGANVGAPKVTCDGGAATAGTPSFTKTSGVDATGFANWVTNGNATFATAGKSVYTVSSGITCDGIPAASKACNELTITAPAVTCAFAKSSYKAGEKVLAPTVTCDNSSAAAGTKTFTKVSGETAAAPAEWATTGNSTTYSTTGSSTYKVSGVTCGGITAAEANCTALTITAAPTINCVFSPTSVTAGVPVNGPAITCVGAGETVDITAATFSASSGQAAQNNTWATGGTATFASTGTSTQTVSNVTCDGIITASKACNALTIVAPTATCAFAKSAYETEEAVDSPTITCVAGGTEDKTAATFTKVSGIDAKAPINWRTTSTIYEATGSSQYSVSGVKCNNVAVTAAANCNLLTISAGPPPTTTCEATNAIGGAAGKTWEDICPNTLWSQVIWNADLPKTVSNNVASGCYYVKSVSGDINYSGDPSTCKFRVNGDCKSGQVNGNTFGKIDGGVYVYIPPAANWSNGPNATKGQPYCSGGPAPELGCALGSLTALQGDAIDLSQYLSCNDGSTPTSAAWVTGPNMSVAGTYNSLSVTATCGAFTIPSQSCTGSVTVNAVPTCGAYTGTNTPNKTWAEICPNTLWSQVKWNTKPTNTAGCYYVQSVNGDINFNGSPDNTCFFRTNGTCRGTQVAGNSLGQIDGGVYIYIPAGTGWNNNPSVTLGMSPPFCVDKVHALICPDITSEKTAGASMTAPVPVCRSGDAPSITGWTNAPTWGNLAEDVYEVSVSGTCGTSGALNASCGTLTVLAAGSIVYTPITFNNQDWVDVAPGYYTITAVTGSGNGDLRCKQGTSSVNTYTVGKFDGSANMEVGQWANPGANVTGAGRNIAAGKTFQIYDYPSGVTAVKCGYGY